MGELDIVGDDTFCANTCMYRKIEKAHKYFLNKFVEVEIIKKIL